MICVSHTYLAGARGINSWWFFQSIWFSHDEENRKQTSSLPKKNKKNSFQKYDWPILFLFFRKSGDKAFADIIAISKQKIKIASTEN